MSTVIFLHSITGTTYGLSNTPGVLAPVATITWGVNWGGFNRVPPLRGREAEAREGRTVHRPDTPSESRQTKYPNKYPDIPAESRVSKTRDGVRLRP